MLLLLFCIFVWPCLANMIVSTLGVFLRRLPYFLLVFNLLLRHVKVLRHWSNMTVLSTTITNISIFYTLLNTKSNHFRNISYIEMLDEATNCKLVPIDAILSTQIALSMPFLLSTFSLFILVIQITLWCISVLKIKCASCVLNAAFRGPTNNV